MRVFVVVLVNPNAEQFVVLHYTRGFGEDGFGYEFFDRPIEPLHETFCFRMIRPCCKQPDTKLCTGLREPIGLVLLAIVDKNFIRNPKVLHSPAKAVFKRVDGLIQIKSGADYVSRGVVDPDDEVELLFSLNFSLIFAHT